MDATEDYIHPGNAVDGYSLTQPAEDAPGAMQSILCCQCGVAIPPNPAAMCVNCIRSQVDITEGIPKQMTIHFCRGCERYLNPPNTYIHAELESRELLTLCLKRLKGLNKVRLIDAGFIWTEPHSKRVKVKLTIQKEVLSGAILQQTFVVEYVVGHQFCTDCHRQEAQDTWNAVVQVRQKVRHKKTFFHLEQLIIKHSAHQRTLKIANTPDGIDFFYSSRTDAKRMVDFFRAVAPVQYKTSERLIGADLQNNVYNYKYTFSVEIAPICKDDVVCLSPQLSRHFGGINPLCICDRVGTTMHILDPFTLQGADIESTLFWRSPFNAICTHGGHTEYMVLDIEPLRRDNGELIRYGKYMLAEATVARMKDLGSNDQTFYTRTHLGHLLEAGDLVWGFDFNTANVNDKYANKLSPDRLPDVILVKKSYSDRRKKSRKRRFRLKTLAKEEGPLRKDEEDRTQKALDSFLDDIEEDKEYRQNFALYKNNEYFPSTESENEDDDLHIGMDEMLEDFDNMGLDEGPDAADAAVAPGPF
eukprot:TRINITY_DN6105_c0_g1_i2.p1 TRINITY_DN6105_c0_g1~~TRINITY_DN6105_c0_g1_i2.p1  ORF type:complete len:530 (+),score=169.56 TRINITY_DN6105_c0_g1_i2:114-1703(+)